MGYFQSFIKLTTSCTWLKCCSLGVTGLTYSHKNLIDIHCSLGWGFHEQQTVVICIGLCFLQKKKKKKWKRRLNKCVRIFSNLFFFLMIIDTSAHLEIYSSFVGQVRFVSCQRNNNIRACLSLQLFHPVLCTCECILCNKKKKRKEKRMMTGAGFTCYIWLGER